MFDATLLSQARRIIEAYRRAGLMLATAESCTGGLVCGALTAIPGSSDVVERGFVTYSNAAKAEMLGVPESLIAAQGAVSREVALAMAGGALAHSPGHVAVAITGVAGPGGGSDAKPVGLVHFACARRRAGAVHLERRYGDTGRDDIRRKAVLDAFELLMRSLD